MIYKCDVSLKIYSETVQIEEITKSLATEPSTSLRKGERISKRNPNSPVRKGYAWVRREVSNSGDCVAECLGRLVTFVDSKRRELTSLRDCQFEVHIGIFSEDGQANFSLSASTLAQLEPIADELLISVYGAE